MQAKFLDVLEKNILENFLLLEKKKYLLEE